MEIIQFFIKNKVVIIGLILLMFFGIVGQIIHKDHSDSLIDESVNNTIESYESNETEEHINNFENSENSYNQSFNVFEHTEIIKATDTQDNPWGKTAGIFEMEDIGECIFLTPNTGIQINDVSSMKELLSFKIRIHPWVAELSDGAGLTVWLMNSNNDIVLEDGINIESEDEWVYLSYNLSEYENVSRIQLLCNNGKNNDDNGDWVIILEK